MNLPHVVPVIFTRSDSTRLPGKNLLPLDGADDLLTHVVTQINFFLSTREQHRVRTPVVATTDRDCDQVYQQHCQNNGANLFRGHIEPLLRLQELSEVYPNDWLLRVNADSPLLLFPLLDHALGLLSSRKAGDQSALKIINNVKHRSFPYGVSLELFSAPYIKSLKISNLPSDIIEHITPLQHELPEDEIHCISMSSISAGKFDPQVRLTIDTLEDYRFFRYLFEDPVFSELELGSLDRMSYAYRKRKQ